MDQFGGYELLERIGVGGMAEVWKARLTRAEGFEKTVVVKRILPHLAQDPEFVRMFIAEAKLAATLIHANIVQVSDFGQVDGQPFLVMELVDGIDLREVLRSSHDFSRPIQVTEAVLIAASVAAGLAHAHGDLSGAPAVIHRDVSPHNILLSRSGEVKLTDFGVAKLAEGDLSTTGSFKGKVRYASPEQLRGKDLDGRSDIYSLGVVLWELLSGRFLFAGSSEVAILDQRHSFRRTEPPSKLNPAVPKELDEVVLRCLEERPERRFAKASELADALERFPKNLDRTRASILAALCSELLSGSGQTRTSASSSSPLPARGRRWILSLVALAVVLAVAAVFSWSHLQVDSLNPPPAELRLADREQLVSSSPPPPPTLVEEEVAPPASIPSKPRPSAPKEPKAAETPKRIFPVFSPGGEIPLPSEDPQPEAALGTLFLESVFPAEAFLGDESLGHTPIRKELPAGKHLLTLFRKQQNLKKTIEVEIRAGETTHEVVEGFLNR